MSRPVRIALVGNYSQTVTAHRAIPTALEIAAGLAHCQVEQTWLATEELDRDAPLTLAAFDAIWCVPGSPYVSESGALNAICFARQQRRPFLGTCGGYQHAILEYARNVLGYEKAENKELNPDAEMPLIAPLTCALIDQSGEILLTPGSRIATIYGQERIIEQYRCSFGYNPRYVDIFSESGLEITGTDADGDPRVIDLNDHPFFIGTAFQPERSALTGLSHPLITAFVEAAGAAR